MATFGTRKKYDYYYTHKSSGTVIHLQEYISPGDHSYALVSGLVTSFIDKNTFDVLKELCSDKRKFEYKEEKKEAAV